ncbi:hypothetical protein IEQ34_010050 [Dendrobium chrysotoxum]|uniref:Uncharacterized protein n=1 Tax=Dendrobium chrysotoxum TaxID=161865 RepID=A0AAV7H2L7_DENCH|nr:hypothetical protein IEQ34_010050 [Dendrobium chrysotoxum]
MRAGRAGRAGRACGQPLNRLSPPTFKLHHLTKVIKKRKCYNLHPHLWKPSLPSFKTNEKGDNVLLARAELVYSAMNDLNPNHILPSNVPNILFEEKKSSNGSTENLEELNPMVVVPTIVNVPAISENNIVE